MAGRSAAGRGCGTELVFGAALVGGRRQHFPGTVAAPPLVQLARRGANGAPSAATRAEYRDHYVTQARELIEISRQADLLLSTSIRSLGYVARLQPRMAYFTHLGHDLLHARAESLLPPNVRLAYDGLEVEVAA